MYRVLPFGVINDDDDDDDDDSRITRCFLYNYYYRHYKRLPPFLELFVRVLDQH